MLICLPQTTPPTTCGGNEHTDRPETMMKIGLPLLAALGVLTLAAGPPNTASAQIATTYRWCVQPGAPWGPDCAYVTIEQCRAAALGVGFCYQNPAFTGATQGRPDRSRR
jgi:hypothetical protein